MAEETWKPIPGYEDSYEVSDAGRVRSLPRLSLNGRHLSGRLLKGAHDKCGYRHVTLARNGEYTYYNVHKLVLLAFVGPRPEGQEACHNDGDPRNNSASNLRWDTHAANSRDQVLHGTHASLLKTHCPRGHDLSAPNLVPTHLRRGARSCLACKRAETYTSRRGGDFKAVSDRYFSALNSFGDDTKE